MPHNSDRTLIQFFLTMAFVIVVAIFNWIKKRRPEEPTHSGSEREFSPPARPQRREASPPPVAPAPRDWEEELRRLLGGPTPEPPPLPPQPVHEPLPHAPATRPPLMEAPSLPMPPAAPIRTARLEEERGLAVDFAGLAASAQIYQQASELDEQVAERLRQVSERVQRHAPVEKSKLAALEVVQARALVRNPQTLRSVIMASVILGSPKALQS